MPERLLHPADVAEILGVTKRRASELMRTMRCVNVSRNPACMKPRWAVTAGEIDRWQKARTAIPDQRVDTPPARPGRARKAPPRMALDLELFEPDGRIKRRRAAK